VPGGTRGPGLDPRFGHPAETRVEAQSAIHALLAEPVRKRGLKATHLIRFSRAGQPLRAAVMMVVNYALQDFYDQAAESDGA